MDRFHIRLNTDKDRFSKLEGVRRNHPKRNTNDENYIRKGRRQDVVRSYTQCTRTIEEG